MINNEKIMVCVYYGPNGERLIRRGSELAKLLNCPLIVLSVIAGQRDALDQEQERYMSLWENRCKELGVMFLVETSRGRKTAEVIVATAKRHHITQLVIGQSGQTRWQEIMQGSFINELLNRIGDIDLHIVAVQRIDEHINETHEPGIPVMIRRRGQRYEIGAGEESGEPAQEGLFFRDLNTDFDNGLLKIKVGNVYHYIKVINGVIADSSLFEPDKL